jgi:hypothetical protein
MLKRFAASFQLLPGGQVPARSWRDERLLAIAGYTELAGRFAGCSFENGLYRIHDAESRPHAESLVAEAFPQFAGRACPSGFDWLGRHFAADPERLDGGEPLVLMLEPGTGEVPEIPFTFARFHDQLDELREPALAGSFFETWTRANPEQVPLGATQCVGYKIPLFLGGQDALDNLELADLDSY